ncbi:NUDIX hydrolase [Kitasatospora sp. MBT63]|uniref:NUDIX hydrolase n=1 Tax=Kitasatospora sp. MBT63 TaxID=1444768 RepID=UPI0006905240|nr:NUDIX hydrolase [Kitasatospora sp. MBT63]
MIDFGTLTDLAAREGIERICVGVVVRDASSRILMIRRAPQDVLPGLWEYPGGAREDGESIPAGAARVLTEETGLTGWPLEYARHLDFTNQHGRRVRQFVFTTVVPDSTPIRLSHDHDARPTTYGSFLITDPQDRILGMRSTINPAVWNFPGGNVEHGSAPFATALIEAEEELGLVLAAENPEIVAQRRLIAVIHEQAGPEYPAPVCGYVFDGGVLTPEQQARIRLDPAEHTEWRFETAHDWHALMEPYRYQRLRQVLRAHRAGVTLYLERPAPHDDDFEGVLVFVTDPAGRLLMHQREDRPGMPWPGFWTPIGGWREGTETDQETAVREVAEEAGITVSDLQPLPGPHQDLGLPLTRVLHTVWDGPESDLRLGDEGLAVRMVPPDEVSLLKVPSYMQHYLPLLAAVLRSGRTV